MFEQCSNFTIFGGTFITYPESTAVQPRCSIATKPRSPSFRSIPLGDLNLLSEIGIQEIVEYRDVRRHKTGVLIRRQREVVGMRRIYQAQIFGNPGIVTAVIDQGTSFEKWKTEAEKHETFRHPSLVQLYAVTMTQAMNALIYTDGLVSLRDVREFHACSPLASTYVEYGIKRDLYAAFKYWESTTGTWLLSPGAPNYTAWIRVSTGRLCIDVDDSFSDIKHLDVKSLVSDPLYRASSIGYCDSDLDLKLLSRLQLDDIHVLLIHPANYETTEVSFRFGRVALGTIWSTTDVAQVLHGGYLSLPKMLTSRDIVSQPWWYWDDGLRTRCDPKNMMASGWTRITLPADMNKAHHFTTRLKIAPSRRRDMQKVWLSQANSVSRQRGPVNSYCIPSGVKFRISMWYPQDSFTLRGTFMADTPPCDIYLFLFRPRMDWVAGYPVFEIPPPSEALYWSLDPGGTTRLTSTMAEELGVPYVFLESYVTGVSWTQREYNMVAEFHDAKGFHPFSRDVATHLGYPLVEERPCPPTSLSEVDLEAVEYAKTALQTYPKQAFRGSAPRCLHCGGRQPGIKNVVLPDLEVPPIHRHRKYRNVIIRAG